MITEQQGQELADELGLRFLETSAKTNINVEEAFFALAKCVPAPPSASSSLYAPSPRIELTLQRQGHQSAPDRLRPRGPSRRRTSRWRDSRRWRRTQGRMLLDAFSPPFDAVDSFHFYLTPHRTHSDPTHPSLISVCCAFSGGDGFPRYLFREAGRSVCGPAWSCLLAGGDWTASKFALPEFFYGSSPACCRWLRCSSAGLAVDAVQRGVEGAVRARSQQVYIQSSQLASSVGLRSSHCGSYGWREILAKNKPSRNPCSRAAKLANPEPN